MIDFCLLPKESLPIVLQIKDGMFLRLQNGVALAYSAVGGVFVAMRLAKFKGFPYWCVELQDETNTFHLVFPLKSAVFKDLVLYLHGTRFKRLEIEPYQKDGRNRLRVYADERILCAPYVPLPPIRRYRDAKGMPYHCDYSKRLQAILALTKEINAARVG